MAESSEDIEILKESGFPNARWLASGMEGDVYQISDDRVAKLWRDANGPDRSIETFLQELGAADISFAVPQLLEHIEASDGRALTVEKYLAGDQLDSIYDPETGDLEDSVIDALGAVLADLRRVRLAFSDYRVMGESEPFLADGQEWTSALDALLDRRLGRFRDQLTDAVEGFGAVEQGLRRFIAARHNVVPALVHGDIFGGNVLVDEHGKVGAVLDWGFLTIPADPIFDAAIASSVFDLYGPFATQVDERLTASFAERFSYPDEDLLAFKGVYAMLTSNAYDPEGNDGHFEWCARTLNRTDVRSAATSW